MAVQQISVITGSLLNIHKIITRALGVSNEIARGLSPADFKNSAGPDGFFKYVRTLVAVLNGHHLTEDDLAFPYFQKRLPHAPFGMLSMEHRAMVQVLDEISAAVEKCEKGDRIEENIKKLQNALDQINNMWHAHIRTEEDIFINQAPAVMPSVEEQQKLVSQFGEHSQQHSGPVDMAVPFMLYNLPPEDREIFSQDMPAEVTRHLVPIVWKEKWEAMAPFLLV